MSKSDIRAGFTTIEILLVLAVVAVLVFLASGVSRHAAAKALEKAAIAQIENIRTALQNVREINGAYPTRQQFANKVFTSRVPGIPVDAAGRLLDPWGNVYVYSSQGGDTYELISKGRDGDSGSPETDADNLK